MPLIRNLGGSMLLEIKDLKVYFQTEQGIVKSVNGVDLLVEEGNTCAIVGESGCGKSVTSLALMGLLDRKSINTLEGQILLEGKDLLKLSWEEMRKIRGNQISMIFQEPMSSLNPALKIGYQMSEVYRNHLGLSKEEAKAKSLEMIERVDIPRGEQIFDSYPHQLSGGQRQRIMIAMALSSNPKLLIADEPTTALDVTIQAEVLELMKKLKEEFNTSILFITHDLSVVAEIADYVNVMYAGKVVERANVFEIFERPLHPYTKSLLRSRPTLSNSQKRLYTIPGSVPNLVDMPNCCYFCDRCREVMDICRKQEPPEINLNRHRVRCFLYQTERGQSCAEE